MSNATGYNWSIQTYGYVIERQEGDRRMRMTFYADQRAELGTADLQNAHVFPTHHQALEAIEGRKGKITGIPHTQVRIVPVIVEETPGESKREVVELEGDVSLKGLKFAVLDSSGDAWGLYGCGVRAQCISRNRRRDWPLFDSITAALPFAHLWPGSRIVGIREVPSAPSRVIKEVRT